MKTTENDDAKGEWLFGWCCCKNMHSAYTANTQNVAQLRYLGLKYETKFWIACVKTQCSKKIFYGILSFVSKSSNDQCIYIYARVLSKKFEVCSLRWWESQYTFKYLNLLENCIIFKTSVKPQWTWGTLYLCLLR